MAYSGRNRRRTDAYGRVRRTLYGLLISVELLPGSAAAGLRADPASSRPPQMLQLQLAPPIVLTPVDAALKEPRQSIGIADLSLFEARVDDSTLGALRDGLGVDLALRRMGHYHLNLYTRSQPRTRGERWVVNPDEERSQRGGASRWSLGGTAQLIRTADGGRQVALTPELVFQIDSLGGHDRNFEATLSLARWKSVTDNSVMQDRVPQARIRWRF